MISGSRMQFLFNLLYFSDLINTLIAYLYYSWSLYSSINKLYFSLIMTILKIICPALGGFIIDHVQYTLNLLFTGQCLTIVSYIYFLAYCIQEIQDYLFFAIGFQILAQQLQTIIVLTMISKHFEVNQIPKQISKFFQYGFIGRLLCVVITIPIYVLQPQETDQIFTSSKLLQIISIIPGVILASLTICIYRAYPTFRVDAYDKIPELQQIPIQSKGNLLQALKELLNTDRAVIAIAAGSVMSVITIWQSYESVEMNIVFRELKWIQEKQYRLILDNCIQEIPVLVSIICAGFIGRNVAKSDQALSYLSNSSTHILIYFLLSTLKLTCYDSMLGIRIFVSFSISMMLQYHYTVIAITSSSLIGVQKQNYRTQGLSFGLLSMFINIFEIWVLSVLGNISISGVTKYAQLTVIYAFSICFTIIGIIISKMLQFMKQANLIMIQNSNEELHRLTVFN